MVVVGTCLWLYKGGIHCSLMEVLLIFLGRYSWLYIMRGTDDCLGEVLMTALLGNDGCRGKELMIIVIGMELMVVQGRYSW